MVSGAETVVFGRRSDFISSSRLISRTSANGSRSLISGKPTTVSAPDTTDAFQNVIDLASYERKIERQRIALVTLFIVLLIALIFLVDIMQSFGFLFVCLPIILFFLGIWFLRLSHKKSTHKHAFLFAGFLAFAYPLCLILLFCFAFALGGPVPN